MSSVTAAGETVQDRKPEPSVLTAKTVPLPEFPAVAVVPYTVLPDTITPAFGLIPSELTAMLVWAVTWGACVKATPAISADRKNRRYVFIGFDQLIFRIVTLNCLLATTAEARTRRCAPGRRRGKRIAVIRINANGEAVADIDTGVTARTGAIRTG